MFRTSGYFFAASKSGGFWIHAWIFLPSKLVYQISSGSVRLSWENSLSLIWVIWRGGAVEPWFSTNKSPMFVGVEISTTKVLASFVARNRSTACFPLVSSVIFPEATSTAIRLALPLLAVVTIRLLPYVVQITRLGPPARGVPWSPPTPLQTSKS